jgi:hypothetical protein
MHTADHIISLFGGSAALSRETRIPLTTIEGWKASNFIPEWRQPIVLKVAKRLNKPLAESDFPTVDQRISRKSAEQSAAA